MKNEINEEIIMNKMNNEIIMKMKWYNKIIIKW